MCTKGFYPYIPGSKSCLSCSIPMENCGSCISANRCTSCSSLNYYFDGSKCSLCSTKNKNCVDCSFDGTCIGCDHGYYLENKNCKACPTNCRYCLSSMCYICHSGYIPAVDGTCELTKADGCPPGEFKDGTTCKECEEGCLACTSNPGNCQGCKLGYRANSGKCTSCIANCNVCFSATSCNTCKAGYYLVGSRCLECNEDSGDQSSCRSCAMSNYYYGSFNSGTCSASTDKNCYQYDDETGCHTCLDGFAKGKNANELDSCFQCPNYCKTCRYENRETICTECIGGFRVLDGLCSSESSSGGYLFVALGIILSFLILI